MCIATLSVGLGGSLPVWIAPPNPIDDAGFGRSVALEGNLLLVGAPEHSAAGYRAGDVQAFFRFGDLWQPIGSVTPWDLDEWDEFGSDVVLENERGAIACPGRERVYLVLSAHGACVLAGELGPPAGFEETRFGTSVAMHGNLLVVGAQLDDTMGTDAGAVHVFRHDGAAWVHEAHLVPSEGTDFGWAGRSVAVHGDRVAFGANLEPVGDTPAAGCVYLYRHHADKGWQLEQRLTHPDPGPGDYLGYDIAMDADRLVAGAILADGPGDEEDIGEVVTWSLHDSGPLLESTIAPPDLIGGEFGYSVALESDRLVVGAIFHHASGPVAGGAYRMHFDEATWRPMGTSFPPPPQDGAQMGFAVAISGTDVAIGCPRFDASPRTGQVLLTSFSAACPGDADASGDVGVDDMLLVIAQWGPCPTCPGDVTEDGVVAVDDVLAIIGAWGDCPQP